MMSYCMYMFCILLYIGFTNARLALDKRVSHKECNQNVTERLDCGYPGITQNQCEVRECCWSVEDESLSCYHSIPTISALCHIETNRKVQCGSSGIRKEQCLAKGCCWQPYNGDPWCYETGLPAIYSGECGHTAVAPMTRAWRVIGGEEAIPHSWPWMASLKIEGQHWCGASLINEQWVLSAAHCMDVFTTNSPDSLVVLGAHNITGNESTTVSIMMDELIPHEDFDIYYTETGFTVKNDLLLIRLSDPIVFNDFISPVCVSINQPVDGQPCYSSGWGLDTLYYGNDGVESSYPDTLQQFMSPVIDKDVCNGTDSYNGRIHPSMMCAGWQEGGRSNCHGDSGGPLVCFEDDTWQLVGAVSWGEICGGASFPTVYTDVAAHYEWIQLQISKFG